MGTREKGRGRDGEERKGKREGKEEKGRYGVDELNLGIWMSSGVGGRGGREGKVGLGEIGRVGEALGREKGRCLERMGMEIAARVAGGTQESR